jgi:hypothetical protein
VSGKLESGLYQNCVTCPMNLGLSPSFTGTRQCTSLLREVVVMRKALVHFGVRQYTRPDSTFQACSFNHSDISPFKWNQLLGRKMTCPAPIERVQVLGRPRVWLFL